MATKVEPELHPFNQCKCRTVPSNISKKYRTAKKEEDQPKIPVPTIFEGLGWKFAQEAGTEVLSALPTVAECAVHLQLLECFFVLKQRVLRSESLDPVFGTNPQHKTITRRNGDKVKVKDDTLWERRQIKWPGFVEWAVARFLSWRRSILIKWKDCEPGSREIDVDDLPPLDVLMVWHSFLLNPRLFQSHCGKSSLWNISLPWRAILKCIDNSTWDYRLSETASATFEKIWPGKVDPLEDILRWGARRSVGYSVLDFRFAKDNTNPHPHLTKSGTLLCNQRELGAELSAAVIRQGSFIEKMNQKLWIRSPALEGTLKRGISRYLEFLELIKLKPGKTMVPTLDIDLVWHTHQCSAALYCEDTKKLVGRYLNHDDKMEQDKLTDGFAVIRTQYRIRYGKEYRICGCWDCEAVLSVTEKLGLGKKPDDNLIKAIQEDLSYFRAVESARRNKKPLPIRATPK